MAKRDNDADSKKKLKIQYGLMQEGDIEGVDPKFFFLIHFNYF